MDQENRKKADRAEVLRIKRETSSMMRMKEQMEKNQERQEMRNEYEKAMAIKR